MYNITTTTCLMFVDSSNANDASFLKVFLIECEAFSVSEAVWPVVLILRWIANHKKHLENV